MKLLKQALIDILLAAVLAGGILMIIQPTVVRQISMENTFHNGDYLLVSKQAYRMSDPKRGDVVIFKSDVDAKKTLFSRYDKQLYIKRVIGLPGDEIAIKDGHIILNGEQLDEPYMNGRTEPFTYPGPEMTVTVPDGMYYLLGDNREHSTDSRYFGFIEKDRIIGKVFIRLFPDGVLVP